MPYSSMGSHGIIESWRNSWEHVVGPFILHDCSAGDAREQSNRVHGRKAEQRMARLKGRMDLQSIRDIDAHT